MKAVPPKISPSRSPVWWVGLLLATLALGGGAVVFFFNPATHRFYPVCTFHQLTGLNCPGCGMTRAVYALVHGNFSAALRDNALLVFALAGLALRGLWVMWRKGSTATVGEFLPAKFLWPLLVVALAFTVLRNLPMFAFLAP
jgi:hypothetical protein